jgi:hypothetical protein
LPPCDSAMLAHLIGLIPIGVEWEFRVQLKHPTVVLFLDTSATKLNGVVLYYVVWVNVTSKN